MTWYPDWAKKDLIIGLILYLIGHSRARYWEHQYLSGNVKYKEIEVFGSLEELKTKVPDLNVNMDLHKPGIDNITYACKCGGLQKKEYLKSLMFGLIQELLLLQA